TVPDVAAVNGKAPPLRHGLTPVADQVAEYDAELVNVAQRLREGGGAVNGHLDVVGERVEFEHLPDALPEREGAQVGHRQPGEVREGRDDPVGGGDVPLDALEVFGGLGGRGVAGVEQEVDRRLDHVEGVAQLVGDAAGYLPDRRQALAALLPAEVLRLVGVLD